MANFVLVVQIAFHLAPHELGHEITILLLEADRTSPVLADGRWTGQDHGPRGPNIRLGLSVRSVDNASGNAFWQRPGRVGAARSSYTNRNSAGSARSNLSITWA